MAVDLPTPGTPVMPTRWAFPERQQSQQQLLRLLTMVGAGRLDQCDGPWQRRTVTAAHGRRQPVDGVVVVGCGHHGHGSPSAVASAVLILFIVAGVTSPR